LEKTRVRLYNRESSKKIAKVELRLTDIDFFARINAQHLQRVVHNILSNSVKFSDRGSAVNVTPAIVGDKFLLSVRDQGVGIPFEKQGYIFDRFTSAQRPGTTGEPSTGLGLYFSRQPIELHEGRIWFESEAGTGTTFFIELSGY
jgi:two-component system sensor histidine kinase VicK